METPFVITDQEIVINLGCFVHKDYSFLNKEIWLDFFGTKYNGQTIRIEASDGDNLALSGFIDFLKHLTKMFNIPEENITLVKHGDPIFPYGYEGLPLNIFMSTGKVIDQTFDRNLDNAKFLGLLSGRFSPIRFRLAYELDRRFPNNNFLIFQSSFKLIDYLYTKFNYLYKDELAWLETKQFDQDLDSKDQYIDWRRSSNSYTNIWNKFQIEIIAETDSTSDYWFTEKTARCLATGKPFVLIAGPGSLQQLKKMGYSTFENILDESYDQEPNPISRINRALDSLQILFESSNRQEKINHMYDIAKSNRILYNQRYRYVKKPL